MVSQIHLVHIINGFIIEKKGETLNYEAHRKPCHKNKDCDMKGNPVTTSLGFIYSIRQCGAKLRVRSVTQPSSQAWLCAICPMPLLLGGYSAPSDWHRGQLCGGRGGNVRVQRGAHCENHLCNTMESPSTNTAPSRFNLLPPTVSSSEPMKQVKLFRPNLQGV